MHIYRGGCRGNTGQLNEDLIVRNIGTAYKKGGHKLS